MKAKQAFNCVSVQIPLEESTLAAGEPPLALFVSLPTTESESTAAQSRIASCSYSMVIPRFWKRLWICIRNSTDRR
jgi:hypothetical protein